MRLIVAASWAPDWLKSLSHDCALLIFYTSLNGSSFSTRVNDLVYFMSDTLTGTFSRRTQSAGIYFIGSMPLCRLGGPARLNSAMENNGVLNWHMIEQLYPLLAALQTCLMLAIMFTHRGWGTVLKQWLSFPWETGAHDDIQLSRRDHFLRGKVRSWKQVNKTRLRWKD